MKYFLNENPNRKVLCMQKIEKKMEQIYILKRDDGLIKIGRSINAEYRVDSIASIGGFKVESTFYSAPCSNGSVIEKNMHNHFKKYRVKGEWFDVDFSECVNYLQSVYAKHADTEIKYSNMIELEDIDRIFKRNEEIPSYKKEDMCNGLVIKKFNGCRVVTFSDIDTAHKRPSGTAKRNFNKNKKYFIEGEDYFKVCADEIRTRKIFSISDKATEDYTLLTETGYLMVVKSFRDELSWTIQRQLVNGYFKAKEFYVQTKQSNKLPELECNYQTTTPCPVANPFYAKFNPIIELACSAAGITKKEFYFRLMRHLSKEFDLVEARNIYIKERGHAPAYDADIIGYFPDLTAAGEKFIHYFIYG